MSDTPTAPDWWQASDGRWYPPPHPGPPGTAAATGGGTATMTAAPPAAAAAGAPARTAGRSWLVVVVLGAVLVLAGVIITYQMLSTTMGPAGMCGSVLDSLEVDRVGPCRQLIESQSLKAGLTGGGLAVVGLITAGVGFVLRSRTRP